MNPAPWLLAVGGLMCSALTPTAFGQEGKPYDSQSLLSAYRKNNEVSPPIIHCSNGGSLIIAVFSDGRVLLPASSKAESPSRIVEGKFGKSEMERLITLVSSQDEFWKLDSHYQLTISSEEPRHIISVTVPTKPTKKVSVYGYLKAPLDDGDGQKHELQKAPDSFIKMLSLIQTIVPGSLKPFDPGYVEVSFVDYSYAPEESIFWPSNWPSLTGPLCRETPELHVVVKMVIFPVDQLSELEAFLARRKERRAIEVEGWKASVHYRWRLPSENLWLWGN